MVALPACFILVSLYMISASQDVPEVALDNSNCPVGPGVNKKTILLTSQATCRCLTTGLASPSAQAHWYTHDNRLVGEENPQDKSSILTIIYNSSNPHPSYQCRPYTTQSTATNVVNYIPRFRCDYKIVQEGYSDYFICPYPPGTKSLTWQLMNPGSPASDLSTCSLVDNKCKNNAPDWYTAEIYESENVTVLYVLNAVISRTQFTFLTDTGIRSSISEMEVFTWPFVVTCDHNYTTTYVDITCSTDNIFPDAIANLSRQERPLEDSDFYPGYPKCTLGPSESGNNPRHSYSCKWRLKMERMLQKSTFTAEMKTVVSNFSMIYRTPTESSISVTLTVPVVELALYQCPLGDAVRGDYIKIGTTATCKCRLTEPWSAPGQARWYTKDNMIVGVEDQSDKSSTLTLVYNISDPNPRYYCKPFTELPVSVVPLYYSPKFNSSPPTSARWKFLTLFIVFGALLR